MSTSRCFSLLCEGVLYFLVFSPVMFFCPLVIL